MDKTKNQFTLWDIFILALALIFTVLVIRVCLYKLVDIETMGENLLVLSISVSLTILGFQYKALRKKKLFFAWCILSLVLLLMFFLVYKNSFNYFDKENAELIKYATGLKVPFMLLLLFSIFRKLANKYYRTELLFPYRTFGIEENREYNLMDYSWLAASLITVIAGHIY